MHLAGLMPAAWADASVPGLLPACLGMRAQVYYHHSKRPGYKVVPRSRSYVEDMASAKFCLAPTGGGHGKRQVGVRVRMGVHGWVGQNRARGGSHSHIIGLGEEVWCRGAEAQDWHLAGAWWRGSSPS